MYIDRPVLEVRRSLYIIEAVSIAWPWRVDTRGRRLSVVTGLGDGQAGDICYWAVYTRPIHGRCAVCVAFITVADTEGGQGDHAPPPRSPRPNFAVAKVCRIQGWKTRFKKYLVKRLTLR